MSQTCSNRQQKIFAKYMGWKKFFIKSSKQHDVTAARGSIIIVLLFLLMIFSFGYTEEKTGLSDFLRVLPIIPIFFLTFFKIFKKINTKKIYTHSEVIFNQMPIVKNNEIDFCLVAPCETEMFIEGSYRLKYVDLTECRQNEEPKLTDFTLFDSYNLHSSLDLDFDNYSLFFEKIQMPNEANEDIRTLNWFLEIQLENNFGKIYKLDFQINMKDSNDPIYVEYNHEFGKLKNEILATSETS